MKQKRIIQRQVCSDGKASTHNAGDLGLNPGLGRSPGGGNGNPLQCSCLENSMDGGAWWAIVHVVAELDIAERLHFRFLSNITAMNTGVHVSF